MKITDRIKKLQGVVDSVWNAGNYELAVYYDPQTAGVDKLKIQVIDCLGELYSDGAVSKVNLISVS